MNKDLLKALALMAFAIGVLYVVVTILCHTAGLPINFKK